MKRLLLATASAVLAAAGPAHAAVTFNFTFLSGTSAEAQAAVIAAGNLWSSTLADDVTLDLAVGTGPLAFGELARTATRHAVYDYSDFKAALGADATSADDAVALAHLAPGDSFGLLINHTANNPNGPYSATPYVDTAGLNNTLIRMPTANAKALGLDVAARSGEDPLDGCAAICDGSLVFSSHSTFDYDPSDGIAPGAMDFFSVAVNQIGSALGFLSGVEFLDYYGGPHSGFGDDVYTVVSPLDMYRYSALSASLGVIDWTADRREKYFSIDGGATAGAQFSTGKLLGDGHNPSRWVSGTGIMDSTLSVGQSLAMTDADRLAFDVIGWDLKSGGGPVQGVPEPDTWAMMIAGFGLAGAALRRRRLAPTRS